MGLGTLKNKFICSTYLDVILRGSIFLYTIS